MEQKKDMRAEASLTDRTDVETAPLEAEAGEALSEEEKASLLSGGRPTWPVFCTVLLLAVLFVFSVWLFSLMSCRVEIPAPGRETEQQTLQIERASSESTAEPVYPYRTEAKKDTYIPSTTDRTQIISDAGIDATRAILVDLSTGEVLASRKADERIYPASMTKVMTLLVLCDHIQNPDDRITVPGEIPALMKELGASTMNLDAGEVVPVSTLLYGLVLKSGGDAAILLARYVAGTEENFVRLMNDKARELGLTHTHFVNCTGLHDDEHYSTCREMAAIFAYAYDNEFCASVLTSAEKKAPSVFQGTEFNYYFKAGWYENFINYGLSFKAGNWEIFGGKTGYTADTYDENGNLIKNHCLGTYAKGPGDRVLLAVTAGGTSGQINRALDAQYIYSNYGG
ncbi:MAG: D-alanyl-D-alanine carboxypeptidase [Clostridia bacterium]|nr:D-alanyl-D-alanine carboxypeptidase [Clostridia bacterium]